MEINREKQEEWERLRKYTPARVGVGRTGTRPLTWDFLRFRLDHAAAVDSVYGAVSEKLLEEYQLFSVDSLFRSKENYLKRPDHGRNFADETLARISKACAQKPQVQIVVSDGLSASAVEENLGDVYPVLLDSLALHGLKTGTPFFVRGGRVGCMDRIGDILEPEVLVLLIGERPGLASSSSLSAYICYRPHTGRKDSERTVVSNIHREGTPPLEAGAYIGTLVKKMIDQKVSGISLVL